MHYIIDGYNLIFRLGLTPVSLQGKREKLIETINQKASALQLSCTIVFDAAFSPGESTRSHIHHLEIIFSSQGQTADEWIIEDLKHKKSPQKIILVTSDKQLAWYARQMNVASQTIEEFMETLEKRYKNVLKPKKKKIKDISYTAPTSIETSQHILPVEKFPEGSLEYYQKIFETKVKEQIQPPKRSSSFKKSKKNHPPKIKEARDEASEMQRWLRLFENKSPP
jgi:hypothetical protein